MSSTKGTSRIFGDSNSVTPSSYILSDALLETNSGVELKIDNLINNFTFLESLDKPFIECIIQIVDATNFIEEHRINGNEKIKLIVNRSPFKESEKDKIKWEVNLRIAEVMGYVRNTPTKQFYQFRCVSEHMYINASTILVRPFQGTISSLVEKICVNDLKTTPFNINKSSKANIQGIYPSIRPIQAINWLMRNSYENKTPFYFYESIFNKGLVFNSYTNILSEDVYDTYEYKPQFKYSLGTKESYDEVRRRVRKIVGDFGMSKLSQLSRGAYSSTLHTLDIATKKYQVNNFSYDKLETLNKFKPFSDNHKILDQNYNQLRKAKNHFISLNSLAFTLDNYHQPSSPTLLTAEAHLHGLKFNEFKITIPGDFELTVGKKIDLDIIKSSTLEHLEEEGSFIDKYLSGTYIIYDITHTFDEEFTQVCTIKRDSLGVDINA